MSELEAEAHQLKLDLNDLDCDLAEIQNEFTENSLTRQTDQIFRTKRQELETKIGAAVNVK
jgi:hypothetical protein